jgi:hypothetical protein
VHRHFSLWGPTPCALRLQDGASDVFRGKLR